MQFRHILLLPALAAFCVTTLAIAQGPPPKMPVRQVGGEASIAPR